MNAFVRDVRLAAFAIPLGISVALAAELAELPFRYLVLFEPVIFATVVSRQSRAEPGGGYGRGVFAFFHLDSGRFAVAGWASVMAVSFTLSGIAASRDQYDAAATFLYTGIMFAFIAGVPVVVVSQGLRMSDTWRSLREAFGVRSPTAFSPSSPVAAPGAPAGDAAPSVRVEERGDGIVVTVEKSFQLDEAFGRRLAKAMGIDLDVVPGEIPDTPAELEAMVRERWARERQTDEARLRENPLLSVEGWEALKRRQAGSSETARPE
jgi:hypothetical protein